MDILKNSVWLHHWKAWWSMAFPTSLNISCPQSAQRGFRWIFCVHNEYNTSYDPHLSPEDDPSRYTQQRSRGWLILRSTSLIWHYDRCRPRTSDVTCDSIQSRHWFDIHDHATVLCHCLFHLPCNFKLSFMEFQSFNIGQNYIILVTNNHHKSPRISNKPQNRPKIKVNATAKGGR